MYGRTATSSANKCRTCGGVERRIVAKLLRQTELAHKESLLKQKKEFDKMLSRIKAEHVKQAKKLVASYRSKALHEKMAAEEGARQQRILFDQEFVRLKNAHQHSLAEIKQAYTRQDGPVLEELRAFINRAVETSRSQLEELAESTRLQLGELRLWIEQELPGIVHETMNRLENSPSSDAIDTESLLSAITTRDQQIQQALERIKALETRATSKNGRTLWKRVRRDSPAEPYKEDPPTDPEQEILDIIREIAKERHRVYGADDSRSLHHFTDSFGSRMSAKVSH